MTKKELAAMLGVSPSMVSRLARRGMPVDTLERAQRWRKRHLEPGRVKGSRFDPNAPDAPQAAPAPRAPTAADAKLGALLAEISEAGAELEKALSGDDREWAGAMKGVVRALLRMLPAGAWPGLTAPVWLALTADIRALFPPREENPLCADGTPVYPDSMTDEDAFENGLFWLDVASGRWLVNPDWQAPAS